MLHKYKDENEIPIWEVKVQKKKSQFCQQINTVKIYN